MYTLKKSLGQHFLRDATVLQRISDQVAAEPPGPWLEVGPGGGALTSYLLRMPQVDLQAVELDREKVDYLLRTFPALAGRLIHGSILDIEPPVSSPFRVVGNFPYNISSQIVFRMLEWESLVPVVIGMFQKEVAERIAAAPGSKAYGVLSVLTQSCYQTDYLFDVEPSCFQPPPKVMSGVIRLERRVSKPNFRSEADFRQLVKAAFLHRRKTLRNGLRGMFSEDVLQDPLFDLRAERLSVDDFAALTFRLRDRAKPS